MEAAELFKMYVNAVSPITEEEWGLIRERLRPRNFDSGDFIFRAGDTCDRMYYLLSGVVRAYFIDEEGKEFSWSFHYNLSQSRAMNRFVVDYAAYLRGEPTHYYFEVLSPAETLAIKKSDIERLYQESLYWNRFGRLVSEEVYYYTHRRSFSILTQAAKEKYQALMHNYPELFDLVPQKHLASFLGITPQSLSRLKSSTKLT